MFDEPSLDAPGAKDSNLSRIIFRDAPYALLVALALVGVAYTSFAGKSITSYWVMLAPVIGVTCVVTRWRDAANREQRIQLMWMQALHWLAVLAAIELTFVADVRGMMNTDAAALVTLTVLALGTVLAGVHIASWRIMFVGVILALGVPAISWLEQSTLLIALIVATVAALAAPFIFRRKRVAA
jgi:hypothetical protein